MVKSHSPDWVSYNPFSFAKCNTAIKHECKLRFSNSYGRIFY